MSRLIANASGNFTSSGSWGVASVNGVVDTISITTTTVSTSVLTGTTFTPGVETYDGVVLKLSSTLTTGTFTVTLRNITGGVDITSVTVNVTDLPSDGGWVFFKFASSVTTLGATGYAINVVCSVANSVTLIRSGSTNDWLKLLRTTTTAAPGAGDQLLIMNEKTGAGTQNALTITMNNTAATVFGSTTYSDAIAVSGGGTLTFGVSASTNYLLTVAGLVSVYGGSTWNQGTSGARVPSTSTAKLMFSVASNVDSGFAVNGSGVVNQYGTIISSDNTLLTQSVGGYCTTNGTAVTRVSGQTFIGLTGTIIINSVSYTILSVTDASNLTLTGTAGVQATAVVYTHAATANILNVTSTSGWKTGDVIAIASTSNVIGDRESATILTVDSATQVTLTTGLTNQHSGSTTTPAEIIHLTRNVIVAGTSTSLQGYTSFSSASIVNQSYVEFYYLGSVVGGKRGIDVFTITGSYTAIGCTIHDGLVTSSLGWSITGSTAANISITYCHAFNIATFAYNIPATSSSSITLDHCVGIAAGFVSLDVGCTITNISINSYNGLAISINEAAVQTGTINNLITHSSVGGISLLNMMNGTLTNLTTWRTNSGSGLVMSSVLNTTVTTASFFGNTANGAANISLISCDGCTFIDVATSGDSVFGTRYGLTGTGTNGFIYFHNSTFGFASGIKTAHSFSSFRLTTPMRLILRNCLLSDATELLSNTEMPPTNQILSSRHDQTAGLHKRWERTGNAAIDTVTYRTAAPSETLTPLSASSKFTSTPTQPVAVDNGQTITVLVYVNKSASYNGSQPRLIVKANPAVGILTDTVLATASGGTGTWILLTGTTAAATDNGAMVFYVDCDGTAGTVSVDDWSVT